jgi:hypothetical protein
VRSLLQAGADPYQPDSAGRVPIELDHILIAEN